MWQSFALDAMSVTARPWTSPRKPSSTAAHAPLESSASRLGEFRLEIRRSAPEWEPEILDAVATILMAPAPLDSRPQLRPGVVIVNWAGFVRKLENGLRETPTSSQAELLRRDIADTLALLNEAVARRSVMA
ncbi:hypothetical protein BH23BAC4_BH23BAC4_13020 [soil metagenome]